MYRVIALLLGIISISVPLSAKSQSQAAAQANRESQLLSKELTLDSSQREAVKTRALIYYQRVDSVNSQIADTAMRRQLLRSSLQHYRMQLQNVLTESQFLAYRAFILQRKELTRQRLMQQGVPISELPDDF